MTDVGQTAGVRTDGVFVLHADQIEAEPWIEVPGWEGAVERLLWRNGGVGSCAGILSLAPAAPHPRHAHDDVGHHLWILSGSLRIGDEMVGRGSYAYIPPGVEHGPQLAGSEGCTLFYVYEVS